MYSYIAIFHKNYTQLLQVNSVLYVFLQRLYFYLFICLFSFFAVQYENIFFSDESLEKKKFALLYLLGAELWYRKFT